MIHTKTDDNAFTGLEAAIVLIAFVVVAAVFSYVVLGAGFFTTQKAQEAVYAAVAQGTSNIQVLGQVYGISSDESSINSVQFAIGLAPGSPSLDLTGMTILWSTPDSDEPTRVAQSVFSPSVTTISPRDQVQISFPVTGMGANTILNIEIRPSVGASLPFTKTAPAEITATTILY